MARPPAGRHPLNVGSLVLGLVFCGISLIWLLHAVGALRADDLQWLLPCLLVGVGVLGVLVSVRRSNGSGRRR